MDKPWEVVNTNGEIVATFADGYNRLAYDLVRSMNCGGSLFYNKTFHYAYGIDTITKPSLIMRED